MTPAGPLERDRRALHLGSAARAPGRGLRGLTEGINRDGSDPPHESGRYPYQTADAAQKVAVRAGLAVDQRMVRKCSDCPPSVRSKRRKPSPTAIARQMAEALDRDPAKVLAAYDTALKGQTP